MNDETKNELPVVGHRWANNHQPTASSRAIIARVRAHELGTELPDTCLRTKDNQVIGGDLNESRLLDDELKRSR